MLQLFTLGPLSAGNARFYGTNGLPFVMGTTGGDRQQLLEDTKAAGVYAIIAPQMGKQANLARLSLRFDVGSRAALDHQVMQSCSELGMSWLHRR